MVAADRSKVSRRRAGLSSRRGNTTGGALHVAPEQRGMRAESPALALARRRHTPHSRGELGATMRGRHVGAELQAGRAVPDDEVARGRVPGNRLR
jgi:hypothetical protein